MQSCPVIYALAQGHTPLHRNLYSPAQQSCPVVLNPNLCAVGLGLHGPGEAGVDATSESSSSAFSISDLALKCCKQAIGEQVQGNTNLIEAGLDSISSNELVSPCSERLSLLPCLLIDICLLPCVLPLAAFLSCFLSLAGASDQGRNAQRRGD